MAEKVYSIEIEAPIQRVWDEITAHGVVSKPMFGCVLDGEMREGHTYRYTNKDDSRTMTMGEVLEVSPPTKLVHTFLFTRFDDEPSLVTWDLAEDKGVTTVTVTHSRLSDGTKTIKSIDGGWPTILGLFKMVVETGDVGLKTKLTQGLMGAMGFMLPKSTKTENAKQRKVSI